MTTTKVSQQPIAGLVVYWQVPDCHYEVLRGQFKKAGLAGCMEPKRSQVVALKAAINKTWGPFKRNVEVKPLKGRSGYELVHVVRRPAREGGNVYTAFARFYFDSDHRGAMPQADWVTGATNVPGNVVTQVSQSSWIANYRMQTGILGKHKVSRCLARAVEHLWGQPFRGKGGLYWLPPDKIETWDAVAAAVAGSAVDGALTEIHAMEIVHNTKSVAAVTAAVAAEIAKDAAALAAGLDDLTTPVAVVNRKMTAADELLKRVAHYENVLGTALTSVRADLDKVKETAAMTVLLAAAGGVT